MPTKLLYRCEPCNFEYEHLSFGTKWDKAVPPCPECGKALTYDEPEATKDYNYQCWASDGGCGIKFSVELPLTGAAPETYPCPMCNTEATKQVGGFSIVHGNSTTKGASLDVVIGRNAEERWNKLHDRKAARDKLRKDTGSQALSIMERNGQVFGSPIKGGRLTTVTVPDSKINTGEKV